MELELNIVNLADVAKDMGVSGKRIDPWGQLMLQAEGLVGRGVSRLDMEEALMQFVRRQGWSEKMRKVVAQVVQQTQRKQWTADAEASRLATVGKRPI